MSKRRTFISSDLRPYVVGSKINHNFTQTKNSLDLEGNEDFLIASYDEDGTTRYFIDFCVTNNISYIYINLAEIDHCLALYYYISTIHNKYKGIYIRLPGTEIKELNFIYELILEFSRFYNGKIYGSPISKNTNHMKLLHLTHLGNRGIKNPYTQIRNTIGDQPDQVVKSISHIRSIASTGNNIHYAKNEIFSCPIQIQEMLCGINIRVHVIDETVYALKIMGYDYFDYRYSETEVYAEYFELPRKIAKWCIDSAILEGVRLAGIDLILCNDSDWYFFEVNPSPAFSYFEKLANSTHISEILSKHLQSENIV